MASQKITTPKGELRYVQVRGEGKLDYDGKDREYVASVVLPKKEGKKFYKEIVDYFEENKSKNCPHSEPYNNILRKTEEGDYMFSFKTKKVFEDDKGNERVTHIPILNGRRVEQVLPDGVGIGNGSIGSISGSMSMHGNEDKSPKKNTEGVSLWLNAIQISKFIKYVPDAGFEDDPDAEFESFDGMGFNEPPLDESPKKKKSKKSDDEDKSPEKAEKKPKKDKKKKKKAE